jgi:DNA-binding response OmpR family regulator
MDNKMNVKNIPLLEDAGDVELALEEHRLASKSARLPGRSPAIPAKRILLVDDDIFMCQLNRGVLTHSGYEVDAAADGAAGWDALQARQYDLLITDNTMPKVTGIEMVMMLRGRDTTLPVILASGVTPTEALRGHPELKINAILLKPYSMEELLAAVANVLQANDGISPQIAPPSKDGLQA